MSKWKLERLVVVDCGFAVRLTGWSCVDLQSSIEQIRTKKQVRVKAHDASNRNESRVEEVAGGQR